MTPANTLASANPPPIAGMSTALGDVEFTDGQVQNFTLADGSQAVITPHVLPDGNLGLDIAVEGTNASGITSRMQMRLTTQPNQKIQMRTSGRAGEVDLSLTPKLAGR
jgi:hypothetical protein